MISELPASTILSYAAALPGPHLAMISLSVATGTTAAHLWQIAQPEAEPTLLLWEHGNNGLYLSRLPTGPAAQHALAHLFDTTIRQQMLAGGRRRFKLRILAPASDDALPSFVSGVQLQPYGTLFYGFSAQQPNPVAAPSVADLRFADIDRELLANKGLAHKEEILEEIGGMWPSEERFYAEGFGQAGLVGDGAICWCTAEFVSPDRCGIGIATLPAYERRGVATATAARFVSQALARNQTPYWECVSTNIGSRRVAEKVGFTLLEEEHLWVGTFEA